MAAPLGAQAPAGKILHGCRSSRCRARIVFSVRRWCILLLAVALSPVLGFGPREALSHRGKEVVALKLKLEAVQAQARATVLGTAGTVSAGTLDGKSNYNLSLAYSHNPVALLDSRRLIETTKRELARQARDDANAALLAHAELWACQASQHAAEQHTAYAKLVAAEAARKHEVGGLSALDLELARIDQADAELSLRQARKALVAAQEEAKRLALMDAAEPGVLTFTLPDAAVDDVPAYQEAAWELRLAEARAKKIKRDLLPALVFDASYLGKSQVSTSLTTRGPGLAVTAGYPTLYDPTFLLYGAGWTFTVKAELPIDPLNWTSIRTARAEQSLAQSRLATQRGQLVVQLPQARRAAESAGESLALAKERVTLAARKSAAVRAKAAAGAVGELAVLEADEAQAKADVALALAWKGYVQTVGAYLTLANGAWEEQP